MTSLFVEKELQEYEFHEEQIENFQSNSIHEKEVDEEANQGLEYEGEDNDEKEEKYQIKENETLSHKPTKILADIPVGIVDIPTAPMKYYDYNQQIKQCLKKLKSIQAGEAIIITSLTNSNAVGTGKSLFLSILLRKSEIRSLYLGGIFYVNLGEIVCEREYISIIRKLVEDLISNSLKFGTLSNIQAQKWLTLIRPTYGDVRMEDCLQSLREITSILYFSQHSNSYSSKSLKGMIQTRKVLVVLNDVRTDYLARLLRGCGVTFLVTTRYPDLFADDYSKGSLFPLEFCPPDHRSHIIELPPDRSIPSSTPSSATILNEIFESCTTWGEVDLIMRYVDNRYHDISFLSDLRARRNMDLVPDSASTRWVTDHVDDYWKSISLTQHIGSFSTYLMLYDSLSSPHKLNYLALSLLPCGVVLPIQFVMKLWGIKIQQDCLDILNIFCKKGLVSSLTIEGVKFYTLTTLQSHLLILLILREKQTNSDDCAFLTTFLMCTILTNTKDSNEISTIQSYLHGVFNIIVKYLTDKKKFATLPTYRLSKYLVYWRRLITCFHAGILPSFHGPLHYFHEIIKVSNIFQESLCLFDYIYAATYIIENLDVESEINLKNWLMKGIEIINYMEASQHLISNHSNTSTINIFNQFKIAELKNKLGVLYRCEGQCKAALDLHISALSTFQSSRHPSGSPYYNEIAKTFLHIAEVYVAEGTLDDAINVIQSVIQFQQGISTSNGHASRNGTTNLVIAEIWMSLGDIYCYQNKIQDSIQSYQNAVDIYHKCVGSHHPDAVYAEGILGILLLKLNSNLKNLSQENMITSPLMESHEQDSVSSSEVTLTSSESQAQAPEILSSSSNQRKNNHEEGMRLTSNAIAWFIRRGYSLTSPKLHKLITSLPPDEKIFFPNLNGCNLNDIEASFSFCTQLNSSVPPLLLSPQSTGLPRFNSEASR